MQNCLFTSGYKYRILNENYWILRWCFFSLKEIIYDNTVNNKMCVVSFGNTINYQCLD